MQWPRLSQPLQNEWSEAVKSTLKLASFLCLIALAGCVNSTPPGNGCEWVNPPPPPQLCEPGQDPTVDADMIGQCTALTKEFGDWVLGTTALGRENCGWR